MLRILDIKQLTVNFDDYEIYEELGMSSFSKVFRAIDIKTRKEVSLKVVLDDQTKIYNYLKSLITINHLNLPGFIKIIGYQIYFPKEKVPAFLKTVFYDFNPENNFYLIIVEELMSNSDLSIFIEKSILTPTMKSKIIYGISSTMKSLHKNKILYRDLKPYHIKLDDNYEPKLSYCSLILSLENESNEQIEGGVGSLKYMAPEIVCEEDYSFPADVYSFSIILYEIFARKYKFSIKNKVMGKLPDKPKNVPDCFWELIQLCWSVDPNKRPTFDEITNMLKDDKYKIIESDEETNLMELHRYQRKIESVNFLNS